MDAFARFAFEPHGAVVVVLGSLALGMLLWGVARELRDYDRGE